MEQTTQNTPAEVVYQPEAELPPITSLDDLSHIRAIDKQGRSVTMTPAQIRELTGLDYSKLEEQIVPGEYWEVNGVRKQVYVRTFVGTLSADDEMTVIASGVTSAHVVTGIVWNYGGPKSPIPFVLLGSLSAPGGLWISFNIQTTGNLFLFHSKIYCSNSYNITFKYTK